jgi:hypothetical protein
MAKTVLVVALFAAGIAGFEGWNAHRQIVDLHNQVTDLESQLKADEENETKDALNIDQVAESTIRNATDMMALERKLKPRREETTRALR